MEPIVTFQDRTIVVTGAGQGIGKAICELIIGLGGNVIALDMNGETLATAMESLPADRVMQAQGSVTDTDLATRVVADGVARFGAIHGLVNNAGITRPALIEKMTREQWQDVIDVHMTGSFYWTQAVGRHMIERSKAGDKTGGAILYVSSDAGRKGSIGQINYSAAKAGMLAMAMTAAREWARYNIRSNAICFGVVETPMTEVVRGEKFKDGMLAQIPMNRWSTPEEVVKSVCFLLSDASSYTTGQYLAVNGGFHISV
jgi:3-oxoacyl-[acyl-carrier protein] reductase